VKICVRPALTTRARATNRRPTAGRRQLTEKCEASTRPAKVLAAKPQAVSIRAPISPACRKPLYWPASARHGISNSTSPGLALSTSKPAQRLNSALAFTAWTAASNAGPVAGVGRVSVMGGPPEC